MNYEYKEKEKKNGPFVSIRDKDENSLLEVERKGNQVEIVTYMRMIKRQNSQCQWNCLKKCPKE